MFDDSVHKGTQNCKNNDDSEGHESSTEQHEHWTWTCASHCPSQTEYRSTKDISGKTTLKWLPGDFLTIDGFHVGLLHDLNHDDTEDHSRPNDSIHVE